MKKALALVLVVLTLSAGGMCAAVSMLSKQQDQVEITQISETGNPAALEGLEVVLDSRASDSQMHWITTYRPGQNPVVDTLSYYKRFWNEDSRYDYIDQDYYKDQQKRRMVLSYYLHETDYGNVEPENYTGLDLEFLQLEQSTEPGTQSARTIAVRDYQPFYHISANFYLTDVEGYVEGYVRGENWKELMAAEDALEEKLNQFLRIPVHESEKVTIHLAKDSKGNVSDFGIERQNEDAFQFYVSSDYSLATDEAFYFTFNNRTEQGAVVDTSLIPGGYGIYRIPYTVDFDPNKETGILIDQIATVYSIDPNHEVLRLHSSHDKSKLLLHTLENGWYVLTVIDRESMTALQRFEIQEKAPEHDFWKLWEDEEQDIFMVEVDKSYAFFALQEDGTYAQVFHCEIPTKVHGRSQYSDMTYDGKRLVVGDVHNWLDTTGTAQGVFYLSVYDAGGLRYYGEYDTSLNSKVQSSNYDKVRPGTGTPIKLTWN